MADMKDLDLRDWFAGQALGGILSNSQLPPPGSREPLDQFAARVTDIAYRVAEAMMKEGRRLNKQAPPVWSTSISGN